MVLRIMLAGAAACMAAELTQVAHYRIESNVVLISATVLDRHNHPVRGLDKENFRLYEDKAEQSIAYFNEEEIPLSLAVVFDKSTSMEAKLPATRRALAAVLDTANPDDEFSLITFATRPELSMDWTDEAGEVQSRVLFHKPEGRTALLDAIHLALQRMKKASNPRRAIVIFSDGGDNASRYTERGLKRLLEEADVQLYAIDMSGSVMMRQRTPEEVAGPGLLARLCEHAGGRYFAAHNTRDLTRAADQISKELRSQYVLGYIPAGTIQDGRYHRVQLKLERPEGTSRLSVYWRRGYRAH